MKPMWCALDRAGNNRGLGKLLVPKRHTEVTHTSRPSLPDKTLLHNIYVLTVCSSMKTVSVHTVARPLLSAHVPRHHAHLQHLHRDFPFTQVSSLPVLLDDPRKMVRHRLRSSCESKRSYYVRQVHTGDCQLHPHGHPPHLNVCPHSHRRQKLAPRPGSFLPPPVYKAPSPLYDSATSLPLFNHFSASSSCRRHSDIHISQDLLTHAPRCLSSTSSP
jgi:hypothetical protein